MATRAKRPPKRRPVQHPKRRVEQALPLYRRRWSPWLVVAVLIAVGAAVAAVVMSAGSEEEPGAAGLPNAPDYHSLLVAADDAEAITLGTHDGLFQSVDGGRTWERAALAGQDAMNLGHAAQGVTWTAGHDVLAKSTDGGKTWDDVSPDGLPHLDIHGFAVDPRDGRTLWAALAGQGLYRSTDGGDSFELVTREVGAGVTALAVTESGRVLAGDLRQGLFVSAIGARVGDRRSRRA